MSDSIRTAPSKLLPVVALFFTLTVSWIVWAEDEPGEQSELSALLSADSNAGFAVATGQRTFSFPQDHGPHPDFRNEWWYMTGNLDATDGRRFGFELTIFRFALAPEPAASASAWRTNQVYIAHFAVTDVAGEAFYVAERFSRGAIGLAGANAEPFRVWIDDWEMAATTTDDEREHWRLRASDSDFALDLEMVARKAPVLNGDRGLSQKSADTGNASYYYSLTRWQANGELRVGDENIGVSGLTWLDREWSSSALGADQEGWDWFALQLSDGSDLMFYNLRKTDGSQDSHSGGTWVAADGRARHLGGDEVAIDVTKHWRSSAGGRYPAGWDIRIPRYGLVVSVVPLLDDQELFTTVRYWEGAVEVSGVRDGAELSGRGYVELTGYAD